MDDGPAGFPGDWLVDAAAPASDVELALLLVNSMDLLEDPPDRLVDLGWLTHVFRRVGHGDLAGELSHARPAAAQAAARRAAQGVRDVRRRRGRRGPQPAAAEGQGDPVGCTSTSTARPPCGWASGCTASRPWRPACPPRSRLRRRARHQAARGLRQRPVPVRVRRPHARGDAEVLLQLLQRPVRRPRLPPPEKGPEREPRTPSADGSDQHGPARRWTRGPPSSGRASPARASTPPSSRRTPSPIEEESRPEHPLSCRAWGTTRSGP